MLMLALDGSYYERSGATNAIVLATEREEEE
jgi:hypothetical protein